MAIIDLFSKRQKKLRGEVPDVYQYENIPDQLRVQIIHIIRDALGEDAYDQYNSNLASKAYTFIHETLYREYGMFRLQGYNDNDKEAVFKYFLQSEDHERVLDIVELSFKVIDTFVRKPQYKGGTYKRKREPDEAIDELVPNYLQSQLTSLRSLFESGVPTIRNKLGGHGQGTISTKVDDSVASYALHLAASNIVFFAQLEKENFS